jgi:hypothetical protein
MKQNVLAIAASVGAAVLIGGLVVTLTGGDDSTTLLGESGATLARVTGEPVRSETEALFRSLVRPAARPETGFVLRNGGTGPWWIDRVTDSGDPTAGDEYVTSATECPGALIAAGSTGAASSAMETIDPAPSSRATIWRNTDGKDWKKLVIAGAPEHSVVTGITSGRTLGRPEVLVASARTLEKNSNAFALVSLDCGLSWSSRQLPLGTSPGFEYAAAVTANSEGFVMVGSADGTSDAARGIVVWRSKDGYEWTASSKPDSEFFGYSPSQVSTFADFVMIICTERDSDTRLFEWTGASNSWFTAETLTRDAGNALGTTPSLGGAYVIQPQEESGSLFLVRRGGEQTSEKIPKLNAKKFSTLQFFGDGGRQMWIVGQRTDTATLETWSITLPDSATVAP